MKTVRALSIGVSLLGLWMAAAVQADEATPTPTPLSLNHTTQVQEGTGQVVYHAQLRRQNILLGDSTLVLVPDQVQRVGQVSTQQYVARCTTRPSFPSENFTLEGHAAHLDREPVYNNGEVSTGEFVTLDLLPGDRELHLDLTHSVLDTMQTVSHGPCRVEMPVVSIHGDQKVIPVLNPGESTTVQFDGLMSTPSPSAYTLTLTRW